MNEPKFKVGDVVEAEFPGKIANCWDVKIRRKVFVHSVMTKGDYSRQFFLYGICYKNPLKTYEFAPTWDREEGSLREVEPCVAEIVKARGQDDSEVLASPAPAQPQIASLPLQNISGLFGFGTATSSMAQPEATAFEKEQYVKSLRDAQRAMLGQALTAAGKSSLETLQTHPSPAPGPSNTSAPPRLIESLRNRFRRLLSR